MPGIYFQVGKPTPEVLSKIKEVFGEQNDYLVSAWYTPYDRKQRLSDIVESHVSLERAMEVFSDTVDNACSVEVQVYVSDEETVALCIGGSDSDVKTPEWVCFSELGWKNPAGNEQPAIPVKQKFVAVLCSFAVRDVQFCKTLDTDPVGDGWKDMPDAEVFLGIFDGVNAEEALRKACEYAQVPPEHVRVLSLCAECRNVS